VVGSRVILVEYRVPTFPRFWEKWEQHHAARIFIATVTNHSCGMRPVAHMRKDAPRPQPSDSDQTGGGWRTVCLFRWDQHD
jgi:hypothetical protein